jgi:hypothetical protein
MRRRAHARRTPSRRAGRREALRLLRPVWRSLAVSVGLAASAGLNRLRRAHVQGNLLATVIDRIADLTMHALRRVWLVDAIGASTFVGLIGCMFYLRRDLGVEPGAIGGAILVLLYLEGPLGRLIGALFLARAGGSVLPPHRCAEGGPLRSRSVDGGIGESRAISSVALDRIARTPLCVHAVRSRRREPHSTAFDSIIDFAGAPNGNRTRVFAVKGLWKNPPPVRRRAQL